MAKYKLEDTPNIADEDVLHLHYEELFWKDNKIFHTMSKKKNKNHEKIIYRKTWT